jgi:hypothetical protein
MDRAYPVRVIIAHVKAVQESDALTFMKVTDDPAITMAPSKPPIISQILSEDEAGTGSGFGSVVFWGAIAAAGGSVYRMRWSRFYSLPAASFLHSP